MIAVAFVRSGGLKYENGLFVAISDVMEKLKMRTNEKLLNGHMPPFL